jgi:N-acetylmuramoyl-L-alanine amidase
MDGLNHYCLIILTALLISTGSLLAKPADCQASPQMISVIVDPGHGGQDLGGKGAGNVSEKQLTLALARKLVQELRNKGIANPILTRRDDYSISLDDRAGLANHRGGDILISLHIGNSFNRVPLGFSVYYWAPTPAFITKPNTSAPNMVWDQAQLPYWEQSRRLAALLQQELLRTLPWTMGTVQQADLYLLRRVQMAAVVVELGSLNHPGEAAELQKAAFQEGCARAIGEAIRQYTVSGKR